MVLGGSGVLGRPIINPTQMWQGLSLGGHIEGHFTITEGIVPERKETPKSLKEHFVLVFNIWYSFFIP